MNYILKSKFGTDEDVARKKEQAAEQEIQRLKSARDKAEQEKISAEKALYDLQQQLNAARQELEDVTK